MSEIHVYTAEGAQTVHPEERVVELLQSGQLAPETLYWRQGMAEWQPLSTFRPSPSSQIFIPKARTEPLPGFSSRQSRQTLPASASTSRKPGTSRPPRAHFRRYPEPLTTILQIFLILAIGLSGLNLANAVVQYSSISTALPGLAAPTVSHSEIISPTGSLLLYATLGLSLALAVPYLMWVYQANHNSHGFSSIVHFTRGWAVGCNFVPALNLYMPCQVMQEIWKVSRNPRSWQNDGGSVLVGIWWALWLLRIFAAFAIGIFHTYIEAHGAETAFSLIRAILFAVQLVYYGVFFAMITVIVQNQKRLVVASRRAKEALSARASASAGIS